MKNKKFFALLMVILSLFVFAVTPAFAQGVDTPPPNQTFDMALISQLLQSLVLATVPVLGGMAAKWIAAKVSVERAKLTNEQNYIVDALIRTAIFAAEQLKVSEQIDNKFDYAFSMVDNWLTARGISMDFDEIRARIEAEVKQSFPKYPPSLPE